MGLEEIREVCGKILHAEEVEEVAIREEQVPEDPSGVMLAMGGLKTELIGSKVLDQDEGLLSNKAKGPG